jgi:tetratricopeptide (TPR) repeat protein
VDRPSTFGELLLGHRRAARLSQQALATLSGISVRALRELEHGRARAAQRRSAEVLADSLHLSGDDRAEFLTVAQDGRRRPTHTSTGGVAELPVLPPDLVGRAAELDRLHVLVSTGSDVAIVGQPGVGKTVMAVLAARRLREQFPDGSFAVDLRGADEQPLPVQAAFDRLLRAMGVPAAEIPVSEQDQVGVYRALLAKKRVLVLLDNAATEAQVRPLLAGVPGCRTIVTCRRTLAGLEGVRWLHLEPLADGDAHELLFAIVGEERVLAEPAEAAELVVLCGNLPLALRIVGDRLATRPHWSLGYLVSQLRDERTRLTSLSTGDHQVRSAFEMSYRRLSPDARLVFRRLAAVPGADFGVELVQVAAELTEIEAVRRLDELVDASMVQTAPVPGRYRFHDLLRLFAAERWEAEQEPAERDEVVDAVHEHLVDVAVEAGQLFFPDLPHSDLFTSLDEARAWIDLESSNWLGAMREAAKKGWHREVLRLAKAMHWYSDDNWKGLPWEEIFWRGVEAARALGDRSSEAQQLNFYGWALTQVKAWEAALEVHLEALRVAVPARDGLERMWALAYAGHVQYLLDRPDEALTLLEQATELAPDFDFWSAQMVVRYRFGLLLVELGRPQQGMAVLHGVLADAQRNQVGEMPCPRRRLVTLVLEWVARCLHDLRRWEEAAATFATCRETHHEGGSELPAARAAMWEGRCRISAGDHRGVRDVLEYALAIYDKRAMADNCDEVRAELARLPAAEPGSRVER